MSFLDNAEPPKLSVIICTIKAREKILQTQCLPALNAQDRKDFELIIIRDKGLAAARNEGAAKARADFVAFIDDDAIPRKDWVGNIIKNLGQADGITGKVVHRNDDIWKRVTECLGHYDQGDTSIATTVLAGCNMAFRKEALKDIGMFDEYFTWGHEEYDLLLRYLEKYRLIYAPDVVVEHRYAKDLWHYLKKRFLFGTKDLYLWNKHSKDPNISDVLKKMRLPRLRLGTVSLTLYLGKVAEDLGVIWSVVETPLKRVKRHVTASGDMLRLGAIRNSVKTGKAIAPRQITLELTNRCIARCAFCQRWDTRPDDEKKELTTDEWKRIIQGCGKTGAGAVAFSGGEPFLRDDIFELLTEAKRHNLKIHISTNGYYLYQHAERLAGFTIDRVMVSIDSVDPMKHDGIRQVSGLWGKAVAGVRRCKELGIPVAIGAVLFKENVGEVADYIRFSKELGVPFRFQPVHDDIHDLRVADKRMLLSDEDRATLERATEIIRKEQHNWVEDIYYRLAELFLADRNSLLQIKCPAAARLVYFIDPFGDVFSCESRRDLKLGNAKETPIKTIIHSKKTHGVRNTLYSEGRNCVCLYRCTALDAIAYQFAGLSLNRGSRDPVRSTWESTIEEMKAV